MHVANVKSAERAVYAKGCETASRIPTAHSPLLLCLPPTLSPLQKTFDNIKDIIQAIISFYAWVWNTFVGVVSNIANKASDVVQGGESNS